MSQNEAATTLAQWEPKDTTQRALRDEFVEFAADEAHRLRETSTAQHLTASAFIFDPTREHVLLCFHKKGQFWVQLGGHVELGDLSLSAAADREGREESGLTTLTLSGHGPVDVDRHALSRGFGTCEVHWDIGFTFTVDLDAQLVVSDESQSVAWWPVNALPAECAPGVPGRVARAGAVLREMID